MSWTAPMTGVSGQIFTASQFNTHVRDNLLETEAATANTAGSLFLDTGLNSISEMKPGYAEVLTNQGTSSSSYVDLATVGPTVTLDTNTSVLLFIAANIDTSTTSGVQALIGLEISGATTVAVANRMISAQNNGNFMNLTHFERLNILTPGLNTFKLKYQSQGGTVQANFVNRRLLVVPV